ncbi:MAG TPA: sugar transferase [Gemmatimonadaceae bacterium]|jgi:lipopolysaccharide/colanic/teichoic acid biosynthesis glycosyltransferase|nr:sugar transferase [Gemmatimonadaceae bacterium]
MKRVVDVAVSALALALLWPLGLVIAAAVTLGDGGSALFRQERVGRGGRTFRMWKFRTMIVDAERGGRHLTVGRDPRVTRVGAVLRRTKLDELPQLLNVLRGEMSLVGPRPEVPHYVALYSADQRAVLSLTPGITDPASLRYRDESEELAESAEPERTYVDHILPEKIRLNLAYAAQATWLTDIGVIWATLRTLLARGQASDVRSESTPSADDAGRGSMAQSAVGR